MAKSTHKQLLRKHVFTLERRLTFLKERQGGSYDRQEVAALRAAIDCLIEKGGGRESIEEHTS
jgi:hypothetical protein